MFSHPSELYDLSQQALGDSERWFPETAHDIFFTTLALCGEVGEVANILKKVARGSRQLDKETRERLGDEIADVFTYLSLLAGQLGIDLQEEYDKKRTFNEARFGK